MNVIRFIRDLAFSLLSCFSTFFDSMFSRWLHLITHPWEVFEAPAGVPSSRYNILLVGTEVIFGPLDEMTNCIQEKVTRAAGQFAINTRKWPKSWNTRVIKQNDAAEIVLNAALELGIEKFQPPEAMQSAITADTLISRIGFMKLFKAIKDGAIFQYIRMKIFRRAIKLWVAIYSICVLIGTVWLIFRLKEQMDKDGFWASKLLTQKRQRRYENNSHRTRSTTW